ncbi:transposase [Hallella sp.]|uniref:transposase n=1 Tax=Hallella sp. TaxID=2980186 RepID=UPI003080F8FB
MNNIPPVSRALPSCLHGREALAAVRGCAKGRRKKDGSYIQDSEYIRNGTCSIFLFTEPLAGFRYVTALEHRTKVNWVRQMKHIADNVYPQAEKIIMVCDNLNTHDKSSFYEAFPPAEALRLAKRFEFHHTPKHGSRLDIAEIELAALTKQCLGKQRIDKLEDLNVELKNWQQDRNESQKGVDRQFTAENARGKQKHLYPILSF